MQPLVSIVIPCYNKGGFISTMLNSVLMQKWEHIELILVDDGSTDDSHEVIAHWLPGFRARGIEVVAVRQENRGLPAAVLEGLKRARGEFICQVDADDELDPEYVPTLAGWLMEHPEYDWAVCDMLFVYADRTKRHSYLRSPATSESIVFSHLAESFLMKKIQGMVHEYMVRAEYMRRSGLIANYFADARRTQEPQYIISLAVAGGRLKHIPLPLYRYAQHEQMMSRRKTYEEFSKYDEQYYSIVNNVIEGLRAGNAHKAGLVAIARYFQYKRMIYHAVQYGTHEILEKFDMDEILPAFLNSIFSPSPGLEKADMRERELLFSAVEDNILGVFPADIAQPRGRVVAWGASGTRGRRFLSSLKGTVFEPDELWDMAGVGVGVTTPNTGSLTGDDTVLIMPAREDFLEIQEIVSGAECSVLMIDNVMSSMARAKYPHFYDGSITFTPISKQKRASQLFGD